MHQIAVYTNTQWKSLNVLLYIILLLHVQKKKKRIYSLTSTTCIKQITLKTDIYKDMDFMWITY